MLDTLMKVVDKVIDLVKIRDKRLKVRYDEIYKGAFTELQTVHADYMQLFHAAQRGLKALPTNADSDNADAKAVLKSLEEGRVKCWAIRRSLVQLGAYERWPENEINSFRKSEIHFIRMLRWYFEMVQATAGATSLSVCLIDALKLVLEKGPDRTLTEIEQLMRMPRNLMEVSEWCNATIAELDRRWVKTSEAFTRLRFDLAGRAS